MFGPSSAGLSSAGLGSVGPSSDGLKSVGPSRGPGRSGTIGGLGSIDKHRVLDL